MTHTFVVNVCMPQGAFALALASLREYMSACTGACCLVDVSHAARWLFGRIGITRAALCMADWVVLMRRAWL